MLEVRDLVQRAGERTILAGVSLDAALGEVVGLLGPNGAGKSTLLRTVAGARPPAAGRVRIAGLDPVERPREARRKLGWLPERLDGPGAPTVREHVEFVARVRGLGRRAARRDTERVLEEVGLGPLGARRWPRLSQGERRRAGLAAALVGDPEVLVLDEPTSGLDPGQLARIREVVRRRRGRCVVLLSTHLLSEAAATCDRIVILHEGRVCAEGSPSDLEAADAVLTVSARGPADRVLATILAVEGVDAARIRARRGEELECVVFPRDGRDVRSDLAAAVVGEGFGLVEMARGRSALEETFVRVVTAGGETS